MSKLTETADKTLSTTIVMVASVLFAGCMLATASPSSAPAEFKPSGVTHTQNDTAGVISVSNDGGTLSK